MANLKGSGSNDIGLNYKSILNIGTANDGLSNISSTLQTVTDGDGNTTPFQLSTTKIGIYGGSNRVVEFNAITGDWIGYGSSQMSPYNFSTGNFEIQADSNFNIDFRIGTNTKMFLTNSGNLGIGTTTTSARLQVKGDGTNNILDLKSGDGVSKFYVNNQGIASAAAFTAAAYIRIGSNFFQESLSDGVLTYYNNAGSGFNRLQFGGTTNAFPALKRTGAGLECRLADDSNYTNISLATLVSLSGVQSYGVIEAYNATTAISVSGPIKWGTTNAFPAIKRNGAAIDFRLADDSAFTSINAESFYGQGYYGLRTDTRVLIGGSMIKSFGTGIIGLQNSDENDFYRLVLGGTTNAFPAIKRNGAAIDFRLADDSGYAAINSGNIVSGNIFADGDVRVKNNSSLYWDARSVIQSPSNGLLSLLNNAGTDFNRLQFGGTTNAFPSIKRNGSEIQVRLADDSAFTNVRAASFDEGTGYTSRFYENIIQLYDGNTVRGHSGGSGFSFNTSGVFGTTNVPVASAILEAVSTTKGFLPPRMTTTQRDAISTPAAGLMIYNTTTNKLNVYTTAWEAITSA